MPNNEQEIIFPAGYWLRGKNTLGTLSQAQNDATYNAMSMLGINEAGFTLGRVHLLIPDLVGQVMRDRFLAQYPSIQPDQTLDITDPSVRNTQAEILKSAEFIGSQDKYKNALYMVNPSHFDRASIIFDMLREQTDALLNNSSVDFEIVSARKFLSEQQALDLQESPEQALFDKREKNVKKHPTLVNMVNLLPASVKGLIEDLQVRGLSKPN